MLVFWLPQFIADMKVKDIPYSTFKNLLHENRLLMVNLGTDSIKGIMFTGPAKDLDTAMENLININKISTTGKNLATNPISLQETLAKLNRQGAYSDFYEMFTTTKVDDPGLVKELDGAGVEYSGVKESVLGQFIWGTIVPIMFWVGLWFLLIRGMGRPGAGMMSLGKSETKIAVEQDTGVRFKDVAGCEEAKNELLEVVDFLKDPERFERLGAKIPKGVLLMGPPGTGKTLMAKALAGEAEVPFFSISGSEFIEMFVGVGAARVRDLFNQAKKNAPCIIFIDEIDAIGKFRGGMITGGHEEREQTLNQLLVEMDGFDINAGVILLAATNRPEVLDPALQRPGRFDRLVVLDAPDAVGREAILKVHIRDCPAEDDIDLKSIAMRTPGCSGADLANIINEAALYAARKGSLKINNEHLEFALEKVFAGPERKSRRLGVKERRRVAFHEAGHGLVAFFCPEAEPVTKISIIPRGKAALGYTLQLPEEEKFLNTKNELLDRICLSLGGRAAEELILGDISTGAQNDLEVATSMARSMICRFGMSREIGPVALSQETNPFLKMPGMPETPSMSPELAATVDKETRQILLEQQERANSILEEHRDALIRIAEKLLEKEVINSDEFKELVNEE